MPDEPRLEEQVLSKAAEITIAAQLDELENIDVAVRTDLMKMVQGQAEAVSIAAQGVVMHNDIRVQEMELHSDRIAIDLLSAVFGQLELDKPFDVLSWRELPFASRRWRCKKANSHFIRKLTCSQFRI